MKKVLFLVVAVVALLFTSCKKEFVITVQSNNESWGSVIGSGTYAKGTVISIGAIAKSGYRFVSWQDGNTENPRSVTVQSDAIYIATFTSDGEEPTNMGGISVSATQKVYFSPGNLQWSGTNSGIIPTTHVVADGGTAAGTWRFAPDQWYITGNSDISSTCRGWIDLFGWGTSGYNNKYPYMTSRNSSDYGNGENDIAGTNYDWGVYNAIYNPKTNTTDAPGTWRTLTSDEWEYLLNTRTTLSGIRYAKAEVNDWNGLIIVPDNWSSAVYDLDSVNIGNATFASNIINATDWNTMEKAGCVFLPTTGYRNGTQVVNITLVGLYWSSTFDYDRYAYRLLFNSDNLSPSGDYYLENGISVRLVKDVK